MRLPIWDVSRRSVSKVASREIALNYIWIQPQIPKFNREPFSFPDILDVDTGKVLYYCPLRVKNGIKESLKLGHHHISQDGAIRSCRWGKKRDAAPNFCLTYEEKCYIRKKSVFQEWNGLMRDICSRSRKWKLGSKSALLKVHISSHFLNRCLRSCLASPRIHQYGPSPVLNWDVFVSAKSTSHSLNMKNGAWVGEQKSMIWISGCRVSLQPLYACVCLCVCAGVAAALLDIWMSNDVVPDWAITTSAHLLRKGWRDRRRRLVVLLIHKRTKCRICYI